ncbi:MAG TPA: Xaa-Pro peptidase family protein [Dissulfurispiraceae bacterium]|nr:Xaa-Pro peptidase family protein [Dissulfurispiraceae bacterium]
MTTPVLPQLEYNQRLERLRVRLREQALDAALFVWPIDIYYFAGTRQNGALWVPADRSPILLVRKSYARAKTESRIPDTRPFPSSKDLPMLIDGSIRRIGMTFDVMPVQYYQYYSEILAGREFVDISMLNKELRSVKSSWEIACMKESGQRLAATFSEIRTFLRRGMSELDLAAEMEYHLRKSGSEGAIRMRSFGQEIIGLSAAGARAAHPGGFDGPVTAKGTSGGTPFGPSQSVIEENVPIIVDYSGTYGDYMMDMTRIFVFGELDRRLVKAFETAIDIQSVIVRGLRPGTVCEDLYFSACAAADGSGLYEHFMGYPGEQVKFVGHGVGLELDELPILAKGFKAQLEEGQAVAVEPKFIFPGMGVVGIENTWLVTSSGAEKLTDLADDIAYL